MATAILSDLHLGTASGVDVLRRPEVLERLLPALADADEVVILGDLLELRERPVARVLELAGPALEGIGRATAGKRVTVVPGNHDHELADPLLMRTRLDGARLPLESTWSVAPGEGLAGSLAGAMPETELRFAYPGLRVRPDVYAIHGHYLDLHLSVPRIESIASSVLARVMGRSEMGAPEDYEDVMGPLYSLLFGLAQGSRVETLKRQGGITRRVWESAHGRRGGRVAGVLLGRLSIPGAVAVMNRCGLGPYRSDISASELRRAGLRAMGHVVEALGIDADHVIFGHTHRPGPLHGDDEAEWRSPGGTLFSNTGNWLNERVFLKGVERESPYWPGTVVWLEGEGPPRLVHLLRDVRLPALAED